MTTIKNTNARMLLNLGVLLKSDGFSVGNVIVPENPWVDGNPYLITSAKTHQIDEYYRIARNMQSSYSI